MENLNIGDIVITKKPHACGYNKWEIVRTGADYKLKCLKCGHIVMLDAVKAKKAIIGVDNGQK